MNLNLTSIMDLFKMSDSAVKNSICAIGNKAALQFKKTWVEDAIVDEEYDDLKLRLSCIEKNLIELSKNLDIYCTNFEGLFAAAEEIGNSARAIFDPYHSLSKSTLTKLNSQQSVEKMSLFLSQSKCLQFGNGYSMWSQTTDYAETSAKLLKKNRDELSFIREVVTTKTLEALKYIGSVGKLMSARQSILTQYSRTTLELNNLLKRKDANQLSVKQSQQLFNQERRAESLLQDYEEVNVKLKATLPELLRLNDELISILQQMVYYVQLTIFYQVDKHLSSFADDFKAKCEVTDPSPALAKLTKEIDSFRTVNRHFTTKSSLYQIKESEAQLCIALFDFRAQRPGDLSIKKGDRVKILDRRDEWWKGELNGNIGVFPFNFVKLVDST